MRNFSRTIVVIGSPRPIRAGRRARRSESGYALMIVVFLVTLLLITALAASPRILMQGKRDKEQEMIWRGKQYVRGVKMYYRKMGRFPNTLDDLTKPKTGSLRFMRQAYKDPMNAEDGSWRLIYVGPSGQLIGSLKPPQSLQLPGAAAGFGTAASTLATNSAGQPAQSGFGSSSFNSPGGAAGANGANGAQPGAQPGTPQNGDQANPQGGAQNGAQPGATGDASQAAGTDTNAAGDAMSTPQAIAPPTETSEVVGGNIIGVGSKAKAPSVMVYEKAKNYHLFEFIWDPSKDTTIAGQPLQSGPGLGQNIGTGQTPFGQQPGATTPNGQPNGQPGAPSNAAPAGAGAPANPPLDSTPAPAPEPAPEPEPQR